MSQKELNLGILAHVDAGKTTLTERLLYEAGAIREVGSVDAGTTQTDSLALEQQRGITIKSAVASFALGDVHVNLIDTPGHPDFIAEVERVLSVLDGAVLVISAVEGVQPQTRILMRALRRLRIPTLLFANKIDRAGAGDERVVHAISERLTTAVVPMGAARELGTRAASFTPVRRGRRRVRGQAGRSACRAGRPDPGGVRRERVGRSVSPPARGARGSDEAGARAPALLRLGAHGCRCRGDAGRDRGAVAVIGGRSRRPALGNGLQDRARPERREGRVRPDVLGDDPDARPVAVRRRARGQGDRDRGLRAWARRAASRGLRRRSREALGPRRGPDRRPDRRARDRWDAAAVSPTDTRVRCRRRRATTARGFATRWHSSPSRTR